METSVFLDILKESAIITLVVTTLMLVIEIFNYLLKGKLFDWMRSTRFGQVVGSALLGVLPGCAGGYISVSMYSRGLFSFGALLAMMVSTTGDEAFLMLALFPKKALLVFVGLLLLGIAAGWATDAIRKARKGELEYIASLPRPDGSEAEKTLRERLLHVLPHALRIFLWTFGVLLLVAFLQQRFNLGEWIQAHPGLSILLAVAIGLIPQSGPHMALVTLFADGMLPLSALIANCIVQEGHAGLPLLAESKSAWLRAKLIKVILAIIISLVLSLVGL